MTRAWAVPAESPPPEWSLAATHPDGFLGLCAVRAEQGRVEDFTLLYANPAAEHALANRAGRLHGRRLGELGGGAQGAELLAAFARVVEQGSPESREVFAPFGAQHGWFRVLATPLGGERLGVWFTDISERKRLEAERAGGQAQADISALEQAVRESEEKYRTLSQASFDGIILHDGGLILEANEAFCAMFGYTPQEVVGGPALRFVAPESLETVRRAIASGTASCYEVLGLRKDGTRIHLEVVTRVLEYRGQRVRSAAMRDITARKRAEAEYMSLLEREREARAQVEESRALLDILITTAPVGLSFLDRNLRYLRINQHQADINGVPVEQTLGRTLREVVPALAPGLEPIYQQVFETGEPFINLDVSGSTPAIPGDVRHWLVSYYPVRNRAGEIFLVGTAVVEVTEHKRAEEALRQSEERFRLLVEGVKDYALIMLDPEGRVASWNAGAERINGYSVEEILGQHISRFYPEEDARAGKPEHTLAMAVAEGCSEETGLRVRKDGSCFWANVLITTLRDDWGRLRGFAKVTRDVTERRQAEEALRETSARLRAILDSAVDGIITIDERGIIQGANPATSRLFGYSTEELIGRNLRMLMPEPYRSQHDGYLRRYLDTGQRRIIGVGREVLGLRKDGNIFPLELAVSETMLPQGRLFTGIVRDITERTLAEAQARQQAEFEQQLIGIVSHDLRNPLSVIALAVGALLRQGEGLEERVLRSLVRIQAATDRATRMILDLLDFTQARLGGGIPIKPRSLDLHTLARQVVEEIHSLFPEREVRVHHKGSAQGEWDADRLSQVLANLVTNALKYSPPGTPVTVLTSGEGEEVALEVHNQGTPIPAESLPRLFEPLQRATQQVDKAGRSVGLGLYIVKHLVEAHAGHIGVCSSREEGTTFSVHLPRHACQGAR